MSTQPAETEARERLSRDTNKCWKDCQDSDDAGADDAGSGEDMDGCLEGHTPKLPGCVRGLLACVKENAGHRHRASFGDLRSCVREAHACFIEHLRERWHDRHQDASVEPEVDASVDAGEIGGTGGTGATGGTGGNGGAAGEVGPERDTRGDSADAGPGDDDSRGARWWRRHRGRN